MKKGYRVNEMFYSLQGEGAMVGTPAVFIRFAGCNLKCSFCDTRHNEGMKMSADQIMDFVRLFYKTTNVILTGGEPMLQVDEQLVRMLGEYSYSIGMETNGTVKIPQKIRDEINWLTVSPKLEWNMKVCFSGFFNSVKQKSCNEVKIVCPNGIPGMGTMDVEDLNAIRAFFSAGSFMLQPCSMKNVRETAELVLNAGSPWRLSYQTQKAIGIR
jgi:organic radical activating enzyme